VVQIGKPLKEDGGSCASRRVMARPQAHESNLVVPAQCNGAAKPAVARSGRRLGTAKRCRQPSETCSNPVIRIPELTLYFRLIEISTAVSGSR
jgi:hypothetical protein